MAEPITIALTGDVMLGRLVNEVVPQRGYAYPWGDVIRTLREADLAMVNLECALTAHARPWRGGLAKPFYFRAEPSLVNALRLAGVDFVSLANNHAMDFEEEGLIDTVRLLDTVGIGHAGAGAGLEAARAPARLTRRGLRVSVVAFADYPEEWAATESAPGINYTPVSLTPEDFRRVESAIAGARRGADLVVFSIHWGPNMNERPSGRFRAFARAVIEAGVDVFWGHSAHVVQGIEFWRGRPILYDSGDFVDDYAVDPELRNDLGALFRLTVTRAGVHSLEIVPVKIDDMQVNRAAGLERRWFVERLERLCREMGTDVVESEGALTVRPLD
jgi:poly-gamma-glutamate synthesis protein (capsule biosynthesis protein)